LVVGCWLLVVGCWLLVVGCWLLVVGCWLYGRKGNLRVIIIGYIPQVGNNNRFSFQQGGNFLEGFHLINYLNTNLNHYLD
jgi:hypothetical protein